MVESTGKIQFPVMIDMDTYEQRMADMEARREKLRASGFPQLISNKETILEHVSRHLYDTWIWSV